MESSADDQLPRDLLTVHFIPRVRNRLRLRLRINVPIQRSQVSAVFSVDEVFFGDLSYACEPDLEVADK